jgi:hypothetical protein
VKHPISWQLVREIQDTATSKEMERAMFARLRWHLDAISAWKPYNPPEKGKR